MSTEVKWHLSLSLSHMILIVEHESNARDALIKLSDQSEVLQSEVFQESLRPQKRGHRTHSEARLDSREGSVQEPCHGQTVRGEDARRDGEVLARDWSWHRAEWECFTVRMEMESIAVRFKRRSRPHHDDDRTLLLPTHSSILVVQRWRRHNELNDGCRCCWCTRKLLNCVTHRSIRTALQRVLSLCTLLTQT